jgi:hypothetical protein
MPIQFFAQKVDFEGYITYETRYVGRNRGFQPAFILYFKNGKIRKKELSILMASHYTVTRANTVYSVSEKQKLIFVLVVNGNPSDTTKMNTKVYQDSLKTILDFECFKKTTNFNLISESHHYQGYNNQYLTTELPNMNVIFGNSVHGCPLYIFNQSTDFNTGRETIYETIATEIVRQSLPDSLFELPKGYKIIYPK